MNPGMGYGTEKYFDSMKIWYTDVLGREKCKEPLI